MRDTQMENKILADEYKELNKIAKKGGVVFFGTDLFCNMHTEELANSFGIKEKVYNRSFKGADISELTKFVDDCIVNLSPEKILVEIGSSWSNEDFSKIDSIISDYEWLLYSIHNKTKATIMLVIAHNDNNYQKELNKKIAALASESGCNIIDVTESISEKKNEIQLFNKLRYFIRSGNMGFLEAMNYVSV